MPRPKRTADRRFIAQPRKVDQEALDALRLAVRAPGQPPLTNQQLFQLMLATTVKYLCEQAEAAQPGLFKRLMQKLMGTKGPGSDELQEASDAVTQ